MQRQHLFLLTHGNWGEGLVRSAEGIIGEIPDVSLFPLYEGQKLEKYEEMVSTCLKEFQPSAEIILVADILGGSPCNIAAKIGHRYNVAVLSGLSMELLLLLCRYRESERVQQTVLLSLNGAKSRLCSVLDEICE